MKAKFWLERWQSNQIGFHQAEHNPLLLEYWPTLNLPDEAKVFVPLCGKSLDMQWLTSRGHEVVGVEIAQVAIDDYFSDELEVTKDYVDRFVIYGGRRTNIYHGDFFDLTSPLVEDISAVFDRAALIALPPDMRFRYVDHMLRIIPDQCKILLITLEYDQSLLSGPPHAVHEEEVAELFKHRCVVELVDSFVTTALPPKFQNQGVQQAIESVYVITKQE